MRALPFLLALAAAAQEPPGGADETQAARLLKNPKVRQAKQECEAHHEKEGNYNLGGEYGNIGDCIWARLTGEERDRIQNSLDDNETPLRPTVTEGFTAPMSPAETRALAGLREHFQKKLADAMRAGFDNDRPVFIDPKTIYDIYEQRVGKNVIEAVTSFCFEAEAEDGSYRIDEDKDKRKAQRKAHLEQLKRVVEKDGESRVAAFGPWSECIGSISSLCYKKEQSYTKRRACEVTNYLQAMKRALRATKDIKEALARFTSTATLDIDTNVYTGGNHPGGVGTDEATTVTSREIAQSEYQKKTEQIRKQHENCSEEDAGCKQFLVDKRRGKETEEALAGFALETKARREKMQNTHRVGPERRGTHRRRAGKNRHNPRAKRGVPPKARRQ